MALFGKTGKLLKNSAVNHDLSMSVFQATRSMSSANLFLGGISYNTLRKHFSLYGKVLDAKIIRDRETGRPRGFGFVTFATTEEASAALQTMSLAIKSMKNQDLYGRKVRVNYATEKSGPGFSGGGYHSCHLETTVETL
ncbi:glycine-rich RNA-binding protein 5, mitochondrial [Medicago truncatula]|uniref:RNA-binding (RRM/RBD/RNP motif) family protein n=1 Tax=Medicago truncatula TaxID=3880 RepID=G7IYQ1_MEDTR|nr:glycine-rich RNA-binding protein 5, mitochondrial [Medicago truncatula]AES68713.2 RNA-binding (RRM/RBD/RNP motif) family protein [Medicago truncatula]